MNELITIVVPVHNTEKYLKRCVDSLVQQIYTDLEILLIDAVPTDDSRAFCRRLAATDKRIKVLPLGVRCIAAAVNAGIKSASGEYVSFIDGGDYVHSECYSQLYEAIVRDKTDLAMPGEIFHAPEPDYTITSNDLLPKSSKLSGCLPVKEFLLEHLDIEPPQTSMIEGKLCRTTLLRNLPMDTVNPYSDSVFLAQWYLACRSVSVVSGRWYYWSLRDDNEFSRKYKNWTFTMIDRFLDARIRKVELFYGSGLTDAAYSNDRFCIQGMLRYGNGMLDLTDTETQQRWKPELEKHWAWFNKQHWIIRNGKSYLKRN
jgi:glycosyltransferase involved in cell wall biosynthesis